MISNNVMIKMNDIRIVAFKILRSYATKSRSKSAGIKSKVEPTEVDDFDEFDPDYESCETDVHEIAESYIHRKRSMQKEREQLKHHIVRDKYFKENVARFLTYVEKQQIKELHESNPEEWTPEKLSQSFPALPDTIRKVLKTNYVPYSVEYILKYDKSVIENWKNFKSDKLPVDPRLREHLMKFKNRKISLMDRETLARRFVRKKIDIPKPKSSFFSSILEDIQEKKVLPDDKVLLPRNTVNDDNRNVGSTQEISVASIKERDTSFANKKIVGVEKLNDGDGRLVFDEFLKEKLSKPEETTPEERAALIDVYRRRVESDIMENVNTDSPRNIRKNAVAEKGSVSFIKKLSDEGALIIEQRKAESAVVSKSDTVHSSLETYVKARISHMETDFSYTKPIRIPKNVYKKGMSYRIMDCYYDDDGQFLYRVPALMK